MHAVAAHPVVVTVVVVVVDVVELGFAVANVGEIVGIEIVGIAIVKLLVSHFPDVALQEQVVPTAAQLLESAHPTQDVEEQVTAVIVAVVELD